VNAFASPYALPPRSSSAIRPPRDVEYDAFSRATAALRRVQTGQAGPELTAALHLNASLWNTLLADLMSPGNQLPAGLRGDLIGLALFSVRHGLRAASGEAGVTPLIDINLAVMRGLRGEVAR